MKSTLLTMTFLATSWSMLGACGDGDGDDNGSGDGDSGGGVNDISLGDGDGLGGADGGGFALTPGKLEDGELEKLRESACTGWSFEPELQPSVLQMIIDVSGSMDREAPNSNETKWAITREALRDAVGSLPGTMSVGAVYFPNQGTTPNCTGGNSPCNPGPPVNPTQCLNFDTTLDVQALGATDSEHRQAFFDSLDDANPAGGTPTHDAYNLAKDELDESDAIGQRFLLLITDGQPTFLEGCSGSGFTQQPVDEQPVIDAITAAAEDGVRTFVIGSPGSEENVSTGADSRPWLSRAAIEGGTAPEGCDENGPNFCHFDMSTEDDFSTALREALAVIVGQITSCTISVPEPPENQSIDPNAVNVVLTPADDQPEVIARDREADCEDGWNYTDNNGSIELCENTCLRLRENTQSGIELLFGCETVNPDVK